MDIRFNKPQTGSDNSTLPARTPSRGRQALFAALLLAVAPGLTASPAKVDGATPLEWSHRVADSEMKRLGESLAAGGKHRYATWNYIHGVLSFAYVQLADYTHRPSYADYGVRTLASYIQPNGTINTHDEREYQLDNILPGRVLLAALKRGNAAPGFETAVKSLRGQLRDQPRTVEGGYWHKQIYPHQMWLDGAYMALPFLTEYAIQFKEPALFDEVTKQLLLMDEHTYDAKTGLYWHAWDSARKQDWADPKTGLSKNFWSRGMGWYGMALVDVLERLPATHPKRGALIEILERFCAGIVRWQDEKTGTWWQLTTIGDNHGNYREESASAMFVYTLAKGVNDGHLPAAKYRDAILRGYTGLIREFVRSNGDGTWRVTSICAGAGLGYKMKTGEPRDGSIKYYVSEPVVDNDPKGTAPLILAGIELQKLQSK